jgi:predicted nucleotidyltransferase
MSNQNELLRSLRDHADDIRSFGARSLYLFGSAARDEMGPGSDVDMFIDYDPDGSFTFVEWARLEEFLQQLLKRDVDLMTRASLHPRLKRQIESASIKVF